MGRNLPVVVTSIIVVALFVLLIYPAVFPVNAPPVLKTFKDIFIAVLTLAFVLACVDMSSQLTPMSPLEHTSATDFLCSLLCTLRC
jgi:hypothetical protein